MNLIMKITSFRINGRSVSRLSINGKAVSLGQEPVLCDALCFTAQEAGSTVKLTKNGNAPAVNLQTSTDGSSWTPYAVEDVITLANANDKVYFKAVGSNSAMGSSSSNYNNFVMTGKITALGNLNSVLEEDEEIARTMSLAGKDYCYYRMFKGCTSLTQAPELPATTLASSCYSFMFDGCTSLNSLKVAFTAWGSETDQWLNNVAATGTFECPQALIDNTTERGSDTVPESWTMVAV